MSSDRVGSKRSCFPDIHTEFTLTQDGGGLAHSDDGRRPDRGAATGRAGVRGEERRHLVTDEPALHRNREYRALWLGQTASALGTGVATLAYPLLVLAATGSPALAGLVTSVLATTTFLVRLPAGVVADRVDRRRLMLCCDAGRFLAVGSVAAAVALGHVAVWHLVVVAVVEGSLGALFGPAEAVAVRRVVGPGQVRDAVAANESRQQVAALLGPALGGALFGWARALPFAVDAFSYAVSFLTVRTVRSLPTPPRRRRAFRAELTEGLRWLWGHRYLRGLTLWLSAAGVVFTSMGLVSLVLARDLGASPAQLGLVFTITGAGGLAGALAAPRLLRLPPRAVVLGYAWLATAMTFALAAAGSVWMLGVLGAVAFFPVPAVNALLMSRVAADVPDALHGRVVTATVQLTTLLHPVGPLAAGIALETFGTTPTVLGYGVLFTVLAVTVPRRA